MRRYEFSIQLVAMNLLKIFSLRELRERADAWVLEAARIGTLVITDRGKSVARRARRMTIHAPLQAPSNCVNVIRHTLLRVDSESPIQKQCLNRERIGIARHSRLLPWI